MCSVQSRDRLRSASSSPRDKQALTWIGIATCPAAANRVSSVSFRRRPLAEGENSGIRCTKDLGGT